MDYSEPEGAVLGRGKDIGSERELAATVLHGQGDGERVCSVPVPRGRRHGDPVHDPGKLSQPGERRPPEQWAARHERSKLLFEQYTTNNDTKRKPARAPC